MHIFESLVNSMDCQIAQVSYRKLRFQADLNQGQA